MSTHDHATAAFEAWVDRYHRSTGTLPPPEMREQARTDITDRLECGDDPQNILTAARRAGRKRHPEIGMELAWLLLERRSKREGRPPIPTVSSINRMIAATFAKFGIR